MSRRDGSSSNGLAPRDQDPAAEEWMRSALRSGVAPSGKPPAASMAAILVRFEWHGYGLGSGTGPSSYTLHPSPPNHRSVQQGRTQSLNQLSFLASSATRLP